MSTHRENVLRRIGASPDSQFSVAALARIFGLPRKALQEVYNRGIGAARTNPQSIRLKKDFSKNPDLRRFPRFARLSDEQWGMARLYSFLDKGKTYQTTDSDIAREIGY